MEKTRKITFKSLLFSSIFAIIVGTLFCFLAKDFLAVLITIIGGLIAIGGIFAIFSSGLLDGILFIFCGALIAGGAWAFQSVILIVMGVLFILGGVFTFAISVKNEVGEGSLLGFVSAVLGGLILGANWGADWYFFIVGAVFVLSGLITLIYAIVKRKKLQE